MSEPLLFSSLFLRLPSPEGSGTGPEGTRPEALGTLALTELIPRMVHVSNQDILSHQTALFFLHIQ